MTPATWASALIAFVNIGLLLILSYVYTQNHRYLRSYYTLGLVIFVFLFIGLNTGIVGLWLFLFTNAPVAELFVDQAMAWVLIINLAQFAGLVSLIRITFK